MPSTTLKVPRAGYNTRFSMAGCHGINCMGINIFHQPPNTTRPYGRNRRQGKKKNVSDVWDNVAVASKSAHIHKN